MRDTGVQKRRVRKHGLGAVRINEDARIDRPSRICTTTVLAATGLSQLTRPDSGAGHDVPCRREDDDLPDDFIKMVMAGEQASDAVLRRFAYVRLGVVCVERKLHVHVVEVQTFT